jgi:hypothetical protein
MALKDFIQERGRVEYGRLWYSGPATVTISLAGVAAHGCPNSLLISGGNNFSLFCHNTYFPRAFVSPFECTGSDTIRAPRLRRWKKKPTNAITIAAPKIPTTIPPIADDDSPLEGKLLIDGVALLTYC